MRIFINLVQLNYIWMIKLFQSSDFLLESGIIDYFISFNLFSSSYEICLFLPGFINYPKSSFSNGSIIKIVIFKDAIRLMSNKEVLFQDEFTDDLILYWHSFCYSHIAWEWASLRNWGNENPPYQIHKCHRLQQSSSSFILQFNCV